MDENEITTTLEMIQLVIDDGRYDIAMSDLNQLIESDLSVLERGFVWAMKSICRERQDNDIEPDIEKLLAENSDPDYLAAIGIKFSNSEFLEYAELFFQKCVKLKPNNYMNHYNLGLVYQRSEQYENAIEKYAKAIQLNPKFAPCHQNMGDTLVALDRLKEAVSSYQEYQ